MNFPQLKSQAQIDKEARDRAAMEWIGDIIGVVCLAVMVLVVMSMGG